MGYGFIIYNSSSSAYESSYVKTAVDAWKNIEAPLAAEARLITVDELKDYLGYELIDNGNSQVLSSTESTPTWACNSNYWTMSPCNDSYIIWSVSNDGGIYCTYGVFANAAVRPVIVLNKSVIGDIDEIIDTDSDKTDKVTDNKTVKTINVPNTYLSSSLTIIIMGFIVATIALVIYYRIMKNKGSK